MGLIERRCPHCRIIYSVPDDQSISTYWTSDMPPPDDYVVSVQGVVVHECHKGVFTQ